MKIIKFRAKSTLKSVGRVFGISLSEVDVICKMIPANCNNLKDAIKTSPLIKEKCGESKEKKLMLETALAIDGLPRCISNRGYNKL